LAGRGDCICLIKQEVVRKDGIFRKLYKGILIWRVLEKVKKEKGLNRQFVVSLSKDLDSDNVISSFQFESISFTYITPEMGEKKYYTSEPRLSEKKKRSMIYYEPHT
jgi:hypothetical protein